MPNAFDLHDKLHAAQLSAAERAQDRLLKVVQRAVELGEKAPKVKTPTPLEKVAAPLEKTAEHFRGHRADWSEQFRTFRERLSATVAGSDPVVATGPVAVKPAPAKKAAPKAAAKA